MLAMMKREFKFYLNILTDALSRAKEHQQQKTIITISVVTHHPIENKDQLRYKSFIYDNPLTFWMISFRDRVCVLFILLQFRMPNSFRWKIECDEEVLEIARGKKTFAGVSVC